MQALIGGAVAAGFAWFGFRVLALVIAGISVATLFVALLSPHGLYRRLEQGLAALAHWVGTALTWLLMPLVFWFFFLPFSLLFRRGRNDSMKRFFERDAESYWKVRDPEVEAKRSRERLY